MRDSVTVLPSVDVAGQRTATTNRETATQLRIDRAQAMRFLPATIADAIATAPGVDLVKTGPWATRLSIRGMYGDRVLLLVDGVRMNSLRGHGAQLSMITLDQVVAVEVFPGAAGAQFGSGALAGVVNVITHRSLIDDAPRVSVVLGSRGSEPGSSYNQSGRLRLTSPRGGLEVLGGFGHLNHLQAPEGRIPNSGHREDNYVVRGGWNWQSAVLDVEHSHYAAHDVGLQGITGGAVIDGSYPLQGREAQRVELAVKGNGALPDLHVLGMRENLRQYLDETSVDTLYIRGRLVSTITRSARDRVATRTMNVTPTLSFHGPGAVRLFGEYRRSTAEGPLIQDFVTRDRNGEVTEAYELIGASVAKASVTDWGGGVSASHVLYGTRLEANGRTDWFGSANDANAGKSIAKSDLAERSTTVDFGVSRGFGPIEPYGHAGTGYRIPNLNERYFDGVVHGGLRLFGNPDLRSERARNYEAGVRSSAAAPEWLRRARVSVYRQDIDDLISFKYIGQLYLIPRFQYRNVQNARIEGIEANLVLRSGSYELGLNATVPRGRDLDTGAPLEDIGTTRASIEMVVPVHRILPNGAISTRVRWNDAVKDLNPALRQPAFSTTSVQADCVIGGLRAVVAVNNLWNNSYREPQSFVPEPGRGVAFSLYREFSAGLPSFREKRTIRSD